MHCTLDFGCHGFSVSGRATVAPCQNRFGSNMRAMGGIFGGSPASASATEHQCVGTPHAHGEIHSACVYPYKLLPVIAKMIEDDVNIR